MPRKKKSVPTKCACAGCTNLLAECGPVLFPFYRKKLLEKGWVGKATAAEKIFQKSHTDWANRVPGHLLDSKPSDKEETRSRVALSPALGVAL